MSGILHFLQHRVATTTTVAGAKTRGSPAGATPDLIAVKFTRGVGMQWPYQALVEAVILNGLLAHRDVAVSFLVNAAKYLNDPALQRSVLEFIDFYKKYKLDDSPEGVASLANIIQYYFDNKNLPFLLGEALYRHYSWHATNLSTPGNFALILASFGNMDLQIYKHDGSDYQGFNKTWTTDDFVIRLVQDVDGSYHHLIPVAAIQAALAATPAAMTSNPTLTLRHTRAPAPKSKPAAAATPAKAPAPKKRPPAPSTPAPAAPKPAAATAAPTTPKPAAARAAPKPSATTVAGDEDATGVINTAFTAYRDYLLAEYPANNPRGLVPSTKYGAGTKYVCEYDKRTNKIIVSNNLTSGGTQKPILTILPLSSSGMAITPVKFKIKRGCTNEASVFLLQSLFSFISTRTDSTDPSNKYTVSLSRFDTAEKAEQFLLAYHLVLIQNRDPIMRNAIKSKIDFDFANANDLATEDSTTKNIFIKILRGETASGLNDQQRRDIADQMQLSLTASPRP